MIITNNLTKKYGDFTALDQLELSVKEGDIYCLLGANGAGKTTTINLLLGFIEPTSGNAFINQLNVNENPLETKRFLAYIPENLMLYPSLTAVENLDYFSGIGGKSLDRKQLEGFLEEAGLQSEAFHNRIGSFSTSGLDPKASNEFGHLLQKLRSKGVATLMATHDLFRAKEVATHIGIMKNGRLRQQFEADDISLSQLEKAYLNTMEYKELAQ